MIYTYELYTKLYLQDALDFQNANKKTIIKILINE
jgi:hypothetical protein